MSERHHDIEQAGLALVTPLLKKLSAPGHPVLDTNRARSSVLWQRSIGDRILTRPDLEILGIEVKTEATYTGNLFLETWSNARFELRRPGWVFTIQADVLLMVYLDVRAAFWLPMRSLHAWLIDHRGAVRVFGRERVVGASRNGEQKNETRGAPIPFDDLLPQIGGDVWSCERGEWNRCELWTLTPAGRP